MTYTTKNGAAFERKSDAVKFVLGADHDLAAWYRDEHGVDAGWINGLTESNCRTYGLDAPGELCDMILSDAGVIED